MEKYSSASAPGVCAAPVTGTCQTPHLDLWGYLANGQSSTEVLHDKCHQHRTRLFSPLQAIPGSWCSHGTKIPGKSALLKNSARSHMMLCPLGWTPLEAPKYQLIKIPQMPPPHSFTVWLSPQSDFAVVPRMLGSDSLQTGAREGLVRIARLSTLNKLISRTPGRQTVSTSRGYFY